MKKIQGIPVPNDLLAGLEKVGVLLFHEFPSTTVLKNNTDEVYIREWVDCSEDGTMDRYYLFKTDDKFLSKFLKGEISHADLVFNSIDGFVFFYEKNKDTISELTLVSVKNIPSIYIPSGDKLNIVDEIVDIQKLKSFINFDNINTKTDLINEIKQVVNKQKTDIYNLHLIKGEGIGFGRIKTDILGDSLREFDNLYKNVALDIHLGKSRGSVNLKKTDLEKYSTTEVVQTLAASFSVLIRPFYSESLLFSNETSSEIIGKSIFTLLNNSIQTDNFREIYSNYSEFTISAYKKFLKEIYSHDVSIDVSYLSQISQSSYNQVFNLKIANKIITDIDNFSFSEEDNFNKTGKFRALNCDTGHFTFISNDGETFSGYMDRLIKEGSEKIVFTKLYQISINRKITKDLSREKPKLEDTIIAFYETN